VRASRYVTLSLGLFTYLLTCTVVFRESKELWGLNSAPDYHVEIIGGEWTQPVSVLQCKHTKIVFNQFQNSFPTKSVTDLCYSHTSHRSFTINDAQLSHVQ